MRNVRMLFLVVASSVALVSGCGSAGSTPDGAAPTVASVSKAPGGAPSAGASTTGPRARLDTTRAELNAWSLAYWQCMKDHGARVDDSEKAKNIGFVDPSQASPAIFAACASKKPNFVPTEMDPDLNPNYRQQWHEAVKCMQHKGMPIVETNDGWTFDNSNAVVPANEDAIERDCQIEAFTRR
jgi:hypothetical protein